LVVNGNATVLHRDFERSKLRCRQHPVTANDDFYTTLVSLSSNSSSCIEGPAEYCGVSRVPLWQLWSCGLHRARPTEPGWSGRR
jgi:hypothetical protein